MSETRVMLVETASRIFSDCCTRSVLEQAEQGIWPEQLWQALESTGLTTAARPVSQGVAGVDFDDLASLIRLAGFYCAPVPLAETWLAERMLSAAELPTMRGPLTVAPVLRGDRLTLTEYRDGWAISGVVHRVPWARHARAIVALAECRDGVRTVVVEHPPQHKEDWNYAREPRDTLQFDAHRLQSASVGAPHKGYTQGQPFFEGALFRSIAMAGALEKLLQLTVAYAGERVQFGRPIGKFQAVQQQIAVLATQAAAATAAAHAAADALRTGPAYFEIAAAKSRVGEAAGISAAIAHQVHGAMGFTQEHALQRSTRRLWAWRDEFGSEAEWDEYIGSLVAGIGGEDLWQFVSAPLSRRNEQEEHALAHTGGPHLRADQQADAGEKSLRRKDQPAPTAEGARRQRGRPKA